MSESPVGKEVIQAGGTATFAAPSGSANLPSGFYLRHGYWNMELSKGAVENLLRYLEHDLSSIELKVMECEKSAINLRGFIGQLERIVESPEP